jgi:hypothetical protein
VVVDLLQSTCPDPAAWRNVHPLLPAAHSWPFWRVVLSSGRNQANARTGAQDRIGIAIESTSAITFVGLLNAMAIFPADRNLYLHEAKSSARYSPATFVITYTIVEIGFEVISALAYATIVRIPPGQTLLQLISYR